MSGNWRSVFWLTTGSLALAALVGPLLGLPSFQFVTGREWLPVAGQAWDPAATFQRHILAIAPWSPYEVYYYPLAFLDLLASGWRALFLAILAVLPPGLAGWAPWAWGFYIILMLLGLWAGTADHGAPSARRRAWWVGFGLLALWLSVCVLAVGVGRVAAARAREATAAENLSRMQAADAAMREGLTGLAKALEAYRGGAGSYPAREGTIDWAALRTLAKGGDRPRLAPADPLLAGYVVDLTPRGLPVPEEAGSLPGYPLREVLAMARVFWPSRATPDFLYLEWATPEAYTILYVPYSDRARAGGGGRAWVLTEAGRSESALTDLSPVLEQVAYDHAVLGIEATARRLGQALEEARGRSGAYPLDATGDPDWATLAGLGPDVPEDSGVDFAQLGWRTSCVRTAVIGACILPPYLDNGTTVLLADPIAESQAAAGSDVMHSLRLTQADYRLAWRAVSLAMRAAMRRRAGLAPGEGDVALVLTPAGLSYETEGIEGWE